MLGPLEKDMERKRERESEREREVNVGVNECRVRERVTWDEFSGKRRGNRESSFARSLSVK